MDDSERLAFIAARARDLQSPDDAAALRSLEELTAGAARVISRNWATLSPRLGWNGEGPFPPPDLLRSVATDSQLWAMGFQFIADSVWRRIAGSGVPIGFKAGSSGVYDGVRVNNFTQASPDPHCGLPNNSPPLRGRFDDFIQDAADWRNTALNYAAVLELIAEWLGEKPEVANVKPGPEWAKRADVRKRYFKVWEYIAKPGNAGKSDVEIGKATHVNKDMVSRIRKETREPTSEEIEQARTERKKR